MVPQLEAELLAAISAEQVHSICDKYQDRKLSEMCDTRSWQLTEGIPINPHTYEWVKGVGTLVREVNRA